MSMTGCRTANDRAGRLMRHCEACEIPLGTLSQDEFDRIEDCPICGKPVRADPLAVAAIDRWITAERAEFRYSISAKTVRAWGKVGAVDRKPAGKGQRYLYSEEDLYMLLRLTCAVRTTRILEYAEGCSLQVSVSQSGT